MSIKILIVGPAASGKTTLAKQLQAKGFKIAKLHTTRPKRDENSEERVLQSNLRDQHRRLLLYIEALPNLTALNLSE